MHITMSRHRYPHALRDCAIGLHIHPHFHYSLVSFQTFRMHYKTNNRRFDESLTERDLQMTYGVFLIAIQFFDPILRIFDKHCYYQS